MDDPKMRISFCMDIKTKGAREGLLISTGVFSAIANQNEAHSSANCWPFLPASAYKIPSSESMENIASGKIQYGTEGKKSNGLDSDYPIGFEDSYNSQKQLHAINVSEMEEEIQQQPEIRRKSSTIRLNLFDGNNQQQLVPLQRPPSRNGLLTQFDNSTSSIPHPPHHQSSPIPCSSTLLRDSTTTTTTLEIFRPKADSADFFQLPKGPLSFEKDPVLIVPAKGMEHERRESSETRFGGGGKINHQMDSIGSSAPPTHQKSVQWGESISIPPSSSSTSPSQITIPTPQPPRTPPIPLLSPPQHSSTPVQTNIFPPSINGIQPSPNQVANSTPPIIHFPQSPPPLADHLTIFRQQQQKHSEQIHLASPPGAECRPPRPPKGRIYGGGKRPLGIGENAIPPRPPKPEHLKKRTIRERSQSADPMEWDVMRHRQMERQKIRPEPMNGKVGGPVRSASSNEIFKLYQTRDCLGRIVCEW